MSVSMAITVAGVRCRLRDVPRASWVLARGLAPGHATAVLAVPLALLLVVVYLARRSAYLNHNRDVVAFCARHRPVLETVLSTALMLVVIVVLAWLAVLVEPVTPIGSRLLVVAPFLWIAVGGIVLMFSGGAFTSPVGRETPAGQRWVISGLAQLPGTSASRTETVRELVDEAPAGSVVVAVAATDAHLRTYLDLGFTEGTSRRVHLVVQD